MVSVLVFLGWVGFLFWGVVSGACWMGAFGA